jgi:hypothetical protein
LYQAILPPCDFPFRSLATPLALAALLWTAGIAAADDNFAGASGASPNWFNPANRDQGRPPKPEDNAIVAVPLPQPIP